MICSQNFKDAYFSRMQKELWVIYIWYNKRTSIFSRTLRNPAAETKTAIQEIAFNRKSLLDLVRSPSVFESNQIAQQFINISSLHFLVTAGKHGPSNATQSDHILKRDFDREGEEIYAGLISPTSVSAARTANHRLHSTPANPAHVPLAHLLKERKTDCCVINSHSLTHTTITGPQEGIHWDPPSLDRNQEQHFPHAYGDLVASGGESMTSQTGQQEGHRIIDWPGLKRTTIIIEFQPPAMCRVVNHRTRLPRATSSLALNASRDGASTASNTLPPEQKWSSTVGVTIIWLNIGVNLRMSAWYKKEQPSWVAILTLGQTCYSTICLIFYFTERDG